jgi:hypothetical protein
LIQYILPGQNFVLQRIVFTRRAVCSDVMRGQVDKLTYSFTGPWRIMAILHGASYKLEHCATKSKEKKHASDLSPYPIKLIPFELLNDADNQYGQLYQKFKEHPYKEAGIKGFTPPTPFLLPARFLRTNKDLSFKWPTLAELNNKLFPNFCQADRDNIAVIDDTVESVPGFYTGSPPAALMCLIPPSPSANSLAQHIINSADRLFFISRWISGSTKDICEWCLVCVALAATMQSYPSCLNDGQYAINILYHPPLGLQVQGN